MDKTIDMNRTVYDLTEEYPELIDLLAGVGFVEIKKPAMRKGVAKVVTLAKGSKLKRIPVTRLIEALSQAGFTVENAPEIETEEPNPAQKELPQAQERDVKLIEDYLRRLHEGESLESVRKEFTREFKGVDSSQIMAAEQALMDQGMPYSEIQKLCDIHSALFRDIPAMARVGEGHAAPGGDRQKYEELAAQAGHPLQVLQAENKALEALLDQVQTDDAGWNELLPKIGEVAIHYDKKADLLYPNLKVRYGMAGPNDVMWGVDHEIRQAHSRLMKEEHRDESWKEEMRSNLERMREMIWKEDNILYPLAAAKFTEDEWKQIGYDGRDFAACLGVHPEVWAPADEFERSLPAVNHEEVVLGGGVLSVEQLNAMLNALPVEITFVDEQDINRYFNEGPKVFKRPTMALGRQVYDCHPKYVQDMTRQVIESFRQGMEDKVEIWMEKQGEPYLVTYMAVRSKEGKYLGTMELVQNMSFAKAHFQQ